VKNDGVRAEIERLKTEFNGADESKLRILEGLIEQAAFERIYLKGLNEQAAVTGLVKVHPDNPTIQKQLPVSSEIAKHSATLTNIMDKLIKHLELPDDDDEDGLDDYE